MNSTDVVDVTLAVDNVTSTVTSADDGPSMSDVYAARFVPYTLVAACGFLFNALSLLAMSRIRQRCTVHHTLLRNLAACDIVGSALLWMYYNSPYIFPRFAIRTLSHCLFVGVVLVAPFILSLSASLFSLLMLAVNQYVAICYPIFSTTSVTRRRACAVVGCAWVVSVVGACVPGLAMLLLHRTAAGCASSAVSLGVRSLEVCAYLLAGLIVVIVVLYGSIYREVLSYRRRTPRPRAAAVSKRRLRSVTSRGNNTTATGTTTHEATERNYKAFMTTLLLWGTLVVFWLPYMVFHFISAHLDVAAVPDAVVYVKFYVIDFLPVLNFVTDPIIYGIRMREVRCGYRRLFACLFPCCVREPAQHHCLASVRFSALETTSI